MDAANFAEIKKKFDKLAVMGAPQKPKATTVELPAVSGKLQQADSYVEIENLYENSSSLTEAVPLPSNRVDANENQLAAESGARVPEAKRTRPEFNEKIDPKKSETMSSNSPIVVNWHRPQISSQETQSIDTSQAKTLNRKIPRGAIGLAGLAMHPILPNEPIAITRPSDQQEASSMISLSSVLTRNSVFFQMEPIIDGYQRKDPETIIFPNNKPIMPEITINPMNILRRYANT